MPFVADASTILCWAFSDESEEVADAARQEIASGSAFVPALWWFELRNGLLMNERRKRITPAEIQDFLARVSLLPFVIDRAPHEANVMDLARRHRLTVYDAAYLELALRRREPLATLDKKLAAAATAESVPLLGAPMTALLFDLDGTLVDSDADHLVAFQRVFARHGIALDRALYVREIMGASNAMIGARFLPHLTEAEREAVLDAKEVLYREGLGALVPTRGAIELLAYAQARALPCAVVTNAPRANATKVLAAIGLAERLPLIVTGGECARAKPDPLPYLTALERTGARAENALAFEDSLSGIRAAVAAGIACVGIATGLPAERLVEAGAIFAVADFADARIYARLETRAA